MWLKKRKEKSKQQTQGPQILDLVNKDIKEVTNMFKKLKRTMLKELKYDNDDSTNGEFQ